MNPSFDRYDEYKKYKYNFSFKLRVLLKKLRTVENLDGISINDDSILDFYKQTTIQNQIQQKQQEKLKEDMLEEIKTKEEDDINYEECDRVNDLENIDDNDLLNIIKKKKRESTITYSQRALKKADNLTKFNRKNHSEGNKHISNNDL